MLELQTPKVFRILRISPFCKFKDYDVTLKGKLVYVTNIHLQEDKASDIFDLSFEGKVEKKVHNKITNIKAYPLGAELLFYSARVQEVSNKEQTAFITLLREQEIIGEYE